MTKRKPLEGLSKRKPRERPPSEEFSRKTRSSSSLSKTSSTSNSNQSSSAADQLWWLCNEAHVPIASEEVMIHVLVKRGKKERGMIKDQPPFRLAQIRKKLEQAAPGLRLDQALSLRRHHIRLLNPYRSMSVLRLGDEKDIMDSAEIFERVVETFLKEKSIAFFNDKEQRAKFPQNKYTPDFLLPTPIDLKKIRQLDGDGNNRQILEERRIHWIEVKMFYGASTIPAGTKGAVGNILPKVSKYVDAFGQGAIVFMHGCGDQLAEELSAVGVTPLCGAAIPNRLMKRVWRHQRAWCAKGGSILP
jgi:hypothetical protein